MAKLNVKFELVEDENALAKIIEDIKSKNEFALGADSFKLGRFYDLSIMSIAVESSESVYILDMKKFSGMPKELKEILENPAVLKVMFDCRSVADCLQHRYDVKLAGIYDLQLAVHVILYEPPAAGDRLLPFRKVASKFLEQVKQVGVTQRFNLDTWNHRPLNPVALDYAARQITCFLPFYTEKRGQVTSDVAQVLEWGSKYADTRRNAASLDYDNVYQFHSFMPLGVFESLEAEGAPCQRCKVRGFGTGSVCAVCRNVDREKSCRRTPYDLWKQ